MLTKKDFKAIAEIINKGITDIRIGMYENSDEYKTAMDDFNFITNEFCLWLKTQNPKFDEVKFREAVFKE